MSPKSVTPARAKLGNRRVTGKEQYYTPRALASELVQTVKGLIPNFSSRTVLEPAGGTGAFVEAAKAAGVKRVLSVDIEPKHTDVNKADYLSSNLKIQDAVTISNPPFGRNNSLSIPFFNRAADNSEYIAFIVPRSWRKWSVMNRLDRRFHLIHDEDLAIDYVDDTNTLISKKSNLKTCFQVWQRREDLREIVKVEDRGFVSKVKPEEADIALTVFGFSCGRVNTEFERKANTTRMFLKLNHPRALKALQTADFQRFSKNTAYTEALSFQEINFLLNEALGNKK
jgi:predicted RNA methylase